MSYSVSKSTLTSGCREICTFLQVVLGSRNENFPEVSYHPSRTGCKPLSKVEFFICGAMKREFFSFHNLIYDNYIPLAYDMRSWNDVLACT